MFDAKFSDALISNTCTLIFCAYFVLTWKSLKEILAIWYPCYFETEWQTIIVEEIADERQLHL